MVEARAQAARVQGLLEGPGSAGRRTLNAYTGHAGPSSCLSCATAASLVRWDRPTHSSCPVNSTSPPAGQCWYC